jgi:hypothetical protein
MLAACASGVSPARPVVPAPVTPPVGVNVILVYAATHEIRRLDTRSSTHGAVIAGVDDVLLAIPGPSGDRVLVAYRAGDSTRAATVDLRSGSATELHRGGPLTTYSAAWSPDGQRLGLGYRTPGGQGGIHILDGHGPARSLGCRTAAEFVAWRSASEAIVADGANVYTVRTDDCGMIATLPKAGKSGVTYAPNGRRVAFLRDRPVPFANRPEPEIIPELWIADFDGSNARAVADFQSRPRDPVWSPDGRRLAYEVVSRRWANTTHVVVYDAESNAYSYKAEETPLGVPADFGVCWSPDGRRIAHDRLFARSTGAQAYATHQVIVRDGERERVAWEEILSRPIAEVQREPPPRCRWVGPGYLLVGPGGGDRLVAADREWAYETPPGGEVLGAIVVGGSSSD